MRCPIGLALIPCFFVHRLVRIRIVIEAVFEGDWMVNRGEQALQTASNAVQHQTFKALLANERSASVGAVDEAIWTYLAPV
jgi:hypothetical protein